MSDLSGVAPKKATKKSTLSKGALKLARRYEAAWHYLFYEKAKWYQNTVIEEPHGRQASELAKETRQLAESEETIEFSGQKY